MPLHRIFAHQSTFSDADKQAIADRITAVYHPLLPKFYVVVLFIPIEENSFFVGGKTTTKFVRIVSQHLARHFTDSARKAAVVAKLEEAWAPYIKDRGLDWEMHIEEVDRELWRENGIAPPMPNTDEEKLWIKENRPVPY